MVIKEILDLLERKVSRDLRVKLVRLDHRVLKEAVVNQVQLDLLARKDHQEKWVVQARREKTVQRVFLVRQVQQAHKECLDHPESKAIVAMMGLLDLSGLLVLPENLVDAVQEELKVHREPPAHQGPKV